MSDVTQILDAIRDGEAGASDKLLPIVYDELRQLAARKLAEERPGLTLQPTALVHEAYLRLLGSDASQMKWNGRHHFFAAAAEAIRRILVEAARRRKSLKHGGDRVRVDFADVDLQEPAVEFDVDLIDEALNRLAQIDPQKAELVKLRFFGGMTMPEIADVLEISLPTAERWWKFSRTWLFAELSDTVR